MAKNPGYDKTGSSRCLRRRYIYQTKRYFGSNPEAIQPPKITSPRFARSTVPRLGKPITNGTSLGGPPLGIGKISIGEKVKASHTAHVARKGRRSLLPTFTKRTQLAIKTGKLRNRNAITQKKDEETRRNGRPKSLSAFATLEDRSG